MTQSLARAALAAHQQKLADAHAACDEGRRPLLEARDRLDAARADLRAAEIELGRAQDAETQAVLSGGDGKRQSADVVKASASVDRCRRIVTALQSRAMDLETELGRLEQTARAISADMAPLIVSVVEEIGDDLLRDLGETRMAAARAEARYRSLVQTCQRDQQFRLMNRLLERINRVMVPHWGEVQGNPDWSAFLEKLAADASATPAVEQLS